MLGYNDGDGSLDNCPVLLILITNPSSGRVGYYMKCTCSRTIQTTGSLLGKVRAVQTQCRKMEDWPSHKVSDHNFHQLAVEYHRESELQRGFYLIRNNEHPSLHSPRYMTI